MAVRDFAVFLVGHTKKLSCLLPRLLRGTGYKPIIYASPALFLDQHDPFIPGCAVLNLLSPEFEGLDLQQALLWRGFKWPVIFLTNDDAPIAIVVKAMKAGAVDILPNPVDPSALLNAIRRARDLDEATRRAGAERRSVGALVQKLTPREREVMTHVVAGERNKEIAARLGITVRTVKVHRGNVMAKMQARSLAQLVRMSVRLRPNESVYSQAATSGPSPMHMQASTHSEWA